LQVSPDEIVPMHHRNRQARIMLQLSGPLATM